jgi:hypothetical protein
MDLSGEFISRVDHHRATSNHLAPWTFRSCQSHAIEGGTPSAAQMK